ncbi:DUF3558 domain-containing protein [Pseudonocardiaceae bacterium YIM PH 21723]|nr:DUF3558 domain-containing protein [Pseudonocardiaceae bacterium YIM PH 21723]
MKARYLLLLPCLAVALSACDSGKSDTPTGSTTASTSGKLPARPKEIKIDNLDPCTVLNNDQQKQLLVDAQPSAGGQANKDCSFHKSSTKPYLSYLVVARANEGVEVWLDGTRDAEAKPVDAAGFPAVQVSKSDSSNLGCEIVVDVAKGQSLSVSFSQITDPQPPVAEQCANALKAATFAMQTLQKK